jgi:hypothetical protein
MSGVVQPSAVLVSRDLFFTSKVTGTASTLGIPLRVVGSAQAAVDFAATEGATCVFVDLANANLDVAWLVSNLSAERKPSVVAFGSHVATALLQAARDAGCTEVMPRSRFSAELPGLLRKYAGG